MYKLIMVLALTGFMMSTVSALASDSGHDDLYGVLMADAAPAAPAGEDVDSKWDSLSPDEKRRLLDTYEKPQGRKKFEATTPEQKQEFRDRMEKFRDMSPEDQDRMMRKMEKIREMSPEEWKAYQEKAERFRSLPPEKREEVRRRLDEVDRLPDAERKAARQKLRQELVDEGVIEPRQGRQGGRNR